MHALIVGAQGVGKSTLIGRVRRELSRVEAGLETRRETALADERGAPVYIHRVGHPRFQGAENLAAYVKPAGKQVFPEVFERYADFLTRDAPGSGLIVLDELGFLESSAPGFCRAVLAVMGGDVPVLAAVKPMDTPFLRSVREHPGARLFPIDEHNRDALAEEVLCFLRNQ